MLIDARRLFDFVALEKGAPQDQITIMGQSLGTGVSAGVTALLAKEGTSSSFPVGLTLAWLDIDETGRPLRRHELFFLSPSHGSTSGTDETDPFPRHHTSRPYPCRAFLFRRRLTLDVPSRKLYSNPVPSEVVPVAYERVPQSFAHAF